MEEASAGCRHAITHLLITPSPLGDDMMYHTPSFLYSVDNDQFGRVLCIIELGVYMPGLPSLTKTQAGKKLTMSRPLQDDMASASKTTNLVVVVRRTLL